MITAILMIHILVAVLSLGYAAGVMVWTKKQRFGAAQRGTRVMWLSTISTVVSGVALAVMTPAAWGRTCTSLLAFLVMVLVAHYYQKSVREKTGCPYLDGLAD